MSSREQQWTQSKNADPAAARAVAARWAGPLCAAAPARARGDCRVHAPGGPGAAALEKRKTCQKWKLGKALNRGSRGPGPPRRGGTGHGCRVHCGCAAKRDTAGVAYGAGNEFRQVLTWKSDCMKDKETKKRQAHSYSNCIANVIHKQGVLNVSDCGTKIFFRHPTDFEKNVNLLSTDFDPAVLLGLDEGQISAHFEENVGQLFQIAPRGTAFSIQPTNLSVHQSTGAS